MNENKAGTSGKGGKKKVVDIVEEILTPFFEKEGYILYHKEFVKEGPHWFLRVFIEKQAQEGGLWPEHVTADDCEIVSKYLSDQLDIIDPIEQNYYLEISSPGMARPLLTDEHFKRYEGHLVDIRLYRAIDGKKKLQGRILPQKSHAKGEDDPAITANDVFITIEEEKGKTFDLQRSDIAAANLTIVF